MMHRLRGRAEVARQAHNLEAVGSIPTPATNDFSRLSVTDGLFFASVLRSWKERYLRKSDNYFCTVWTLSRQQSAMDRLTLN